jgi:predicted RecA/RadA family phage recombinase
MSSLGSWPAAQKVRTCRFDMATNQRVNAAPGGSSEQVIDLLNDRLMCYLTLPVRRHAQAAALEAFLASFRGQVNTVDLWHFVRPNPRGTMRGAPTLQAAVAQGAATLPIQTTAGATLLAGDLVGVGGLLFMAVADATANGAGLLTLSIVNRARTALSSGAAVAWDRPSAPFRLLSNSGVSYVPGSAEEVTLVLGEAVS